MNGTGLGDKAEFDARIVAVGGLARRKRGGTKMLRNSKSPCNSVDGRTESALVVDWDFDKKWSNMPLVVAWDFDQKWGNKK